MIFDVSKNELTIIVDPLESFDEISTQLFTKPKRNHSLNERITLNKRAGTISINLTTGKDDCTCTCCSCCDCCN